MSAPSPVPARTTLRLPEGEFPGCGFDLKANVQAAESGLRSNFEQWILLGTYDCRSRALMPSSTLVFGEKIAVTVRMLERAARMAINGCLDFG